MPDDPYADLIRGVVGRDPQERVRRIARRSAIPDDIAEDYLRTTKIESGHNINVRDSPKGAQGFGQVMPDRPGGTMRTVGGRKYNLRDPDQNIEAGLKYFAEGGNDPVRRRLYYFGGPGAARTYDRSGRIPNISDGNMTAAQYVRATGANQSPRPQKPQNPNDEYSSLIREALQGESAQAEAIPEPPPLIGRGAGMARGGQSPPRLVRGATPSSTLSIFGRVASAGRRINQAPKITQADIKRAEEAPQPGTGTYQVDPRLAKGEQPSDPMAYAKAQELIGRTEPQREVGSIRSGARSMQARTPTILERVKETVAPYVPGIASLDTPAGIKTDALRGASSLGLLDLRRDIGPEEKLIDPQAEGAAETAYQIGSFAPAVVPYAAAGKLVSKIPSLNAATREAHIARSALTFGGVELGRELARSAQTGEPLSPKEIAISTAIGGGIGGLAGVNPGLKKQLVAFITPGVVADVARGTDPQTATFNALTNLAFGLHSYKSAPREIKNAAKVASERLRSENETNLRRSATVQEGVQPARGSASSEVAATAGANRNVESISGVGLESGVRTSASSAGQTRAEFQHKDFGKVIEAESQTGVSRGQIRVVDEAGAEHVILKPKGTGAGNIRAIPVKAEPKVERVKPASDLEADGLLSVKNAPGSSMSSQADELARRHPAPITDVQDFHELSRRYYQKLKADQFPDIVRQERASEIVRAARPKMREEFLRSKGLTMEAAKALPKRQQDKLQSEFSKLEAESIAKTERQLAEQVAPPVVESTSPPERIDSPLAEPLPRSTVEPSSAGGAPQAQSTPSTPPPILKREPGKVPPILKREPSITSARQEMMKSDRAELDLPELPVAERKAWQKTLDEAKAKGTQNAVLADQVLAKPRALNDVETGQLVLRAQEIKNEHSRVMKEIGKEADPDVIQTKRAEADALQGEFDRITEATKKSGTEKGRALASQKLTINQDFDLVSVLQRAKAARGRELKPEERQKIETQTKRIEELETKLAEVQKAAEAKAIQKDIERVRRQIKRGETKQVLDDEFASLKTEFAQMRMEIKESPIEYRQGGIGLASLDPSGKLTPIILKMARNRVKAGVVEAEKVISEIHSVVREHIEGISKDDIRNLLAGHNLERDPLPAIKTRLRGQEKELTRRIEEKDYSEPPKRKPVVYDREASNLKARVEQLKRQIAADIQGTDSKLETLLAMRKAGMLTGIRTHMRNVGGTGAFQAFEEVSRVPGAIADLLVSTVTKRRALGAPNPVDVAKSSYAAATKGVREAIQIMKYGSTAEELAKLDVKRELNSGSPLIDRYVNTAFRTLGAEDKIFKTYAYDRSIRDQKRLLKTDKVTPEMEAQGMLDAEIATFNSKNKAAEGVEWLRRQSGPVGSTAIDLILPFKQTPANIASRLLESTPLGLGRGAGQLIKAAINKEMSFEDQRKFSQTIGRSVTGSSLIVLGYWLASKGLATGLTEDDAGDREVQKASGRSPLSIKVGDNWHQIGAFSPIGNLIAVGAALHRERTKPLKEGQERGNLATSAVPVATKVMLEQPFLRGASSVVEAIKEPGSRGEAFVGQIFSSAVPTVVSDAGAAIDNTRRERKGIISRVQERIPILRSRLPEEVDVFARPLQSRRSAAFDPTLTTRQSEEPFIKELTRLDIGVPKANRKPGEADSQLRERRIKQGQEMAKALSYVVAQRQYSGLSDEEKIEALKGAIEQIRKRVNAGTGTTPTRVRRQRERPAIRLPR